MRSMRRAILTVALTPGRRSEIDECIWVPNTAILNRAAPRETRWTDCHSSVMPLGSPMTAASALKWPLSASHLDPNCAPASSSAVNTSTSSPAKPSPACWACFRAAAAYIIPATAAFMSPEPRPMRSPSRSTGSQGSVSQASMSPAGLVSMCPDRISVGPGAVPRTRASTLGRVSSKPTRVMSSTPSSLSLSVMRSATARSSPGGFGDGVRIKSRASSSTSASRPSR